MSHEGGYNPIYVPFCGLAVLEAMSGVDVLDDPILPILRGMTGHDLKPAEAEVIAAAADPHPHAPPARSAGPARASPYCGRATPSPARPLVRQRQRRRRPSRPCSRPSPGPTTATPSPTATTPGPGSARARSGELFGDVTTLLTFNGTGANVLALATLLGPAEAVVCTDWAHIATDETGAPERILGAKLIDLPAADGKLRPEQIDELRPPARRRPPRPAGRRVDHPEHRAGHGVHRPTRSAAVCDAAHRLGMTVHMDGARIANATAALGGDVAALRSFTVDAGVDVLTFGGTKNGLLGGEAVVYLRPELARRADVPAQAGDPAAVEDALRGRPVPGPARRRPLARARRPRQPDGRRPAHAPSPGCPASRSRRRRSTACSPSCRPDIIEPLREWSFFWDWDVSRHQVRWMTAWDTTAEDVERFVAGVTVATEAVASQN